MASSKLLNTSQHHTKSMSNVNLLSNLHQKQNYFTYRHDSNKDKENRQEYDERFYTRTDYLNTRRTHK